MADRIFLVDTVEQALAVIGGQHGSSPSGAAAEAP
jgi:hypothetical protein